MREIHTLFYNRSAAKPFGWLTGPNRVANRADIDGYQGQCEKKLATMTTTLAQRAHKPSPLNSRQTEETLVKPVLKPGPEDWRSRGMPCIPHQVDHKAIANAM